jgi:hypothetical protein
MPGLPILTSDILKCLNTANWVEKVACTFTLTWRSKGRSEDPGAGRGQEVGETCTSTAEFSPGNFPGIFLKIFPEKSGKRSEWTFSHDFFNHSPPLAPPVPQGDGAHSDGTSSVAGNSSSSHMGVPQWRGGAPGALKHEKRIVAIIPRPIQKFYKEKKW